MLNDSQEPTFRVAPRADRTYGDLAADLAASYGLDPDPWQRTLLNDWLSERGGRWAALTCGVAVPRQSGKNALIEIRELFGMVGRGERILHTAHEVKTAQKHFRRLKHFFGNKANDPAAKYPELNALVEVVRSVNGQEAIFLTNGASIELVARSKNSGRGFTVDVLVMDEAQELGEDALEALLPTTAAAPLGNPQWIYAGTPPSPVAVGDVFTRVRREARSDKPGALAWAEWSWDGSGAPEALDDRGLWRRLNPGVATGRLQMDVIEGERARFSDDGFARERLGKWADIDGASRLISADEWKATEVRVAPDGIRSFGVAFSADGERQAVAGAVKHEAGVHVEAIGAQSGATDAGVQQLVQWFCTDPAQPERWRQAAQITISGRSHATVLFEALRAAGVPAKVLRVASTAEYLTACSMLYDAVQDRTLSHPAAGDDDLFNRSVAVSDKKERTRDGGWGWQATTPDGDETPLEAASLALWGAKTSKRVPGRKAAVSF